MEVNPFQALVADMPVWARVTSKKGQNYALLLDMIEKIGSNKAVIMTYDQFKAAFPATNARSSVRQFLRKAGYNGRVIEHDGKLAIVANKIIKPVHVVREDGSVRVA